METDCKMHSSDENAGETANLLNPTESLVDSGTNDHFFVQNTHGVIIVIFVYILFIFQYVVTVYIGIWKLHQLDSTDHNPTVLILNTSFFTILWLMMIWSHI